MSNVLFVLWVGLSAGLLLLFFYAAYLHTRRRNGSNVDLGEMLPSFLPVNIEPLARLIEQGPGAPVDDDMKRVHLTIDCLKRMAHNAALLQQVGYCQLRSPNQLICDLAQEMIDAGVHVRLYSFIGLLALQSWRRFRFIIGPLRHMPRIADVQKLLSTSLVTSYDDLKTKAGNLTCLKFSSLSEELAHSL